MVEGVHRFTKTVGLWINAAKTKVLSPQVNASSCGTITMDVVPLEEVSSFNDLGASFGANGQAVGEIAARISRVRATVNQLHISLWSRREISRHTKGRIYETVGRPN